MRLASLVLLCCLATSCFSMALEEAHDLLKENTAQDGAQIFWCKFHAPEPQRDEVIVDISRKRIDAALDSLEPNGNPEHAPEQENYQAPAQNTRESQPVPENETVKLENIEESIDPALDPLMTNGNSDKPLAPHMPPLPQEQDPRAQNTNPEEPVGEDEDENEDDDANRQNQELERAAQELAAKQVVGANLLNQEQQAAQELAEKQGKYPPHPFPFKPYCKPRPIPSPHTCCNMRETRLNLHYKYASVSNNLDESITVLQAPTAWNSKAICSHRALLKVKFDKITPQHCPGHCQSYPACGRRMLKITMDLHPTQRSEGHRRMFNIGDSESNDGYGGDGNHQQNDAELDGRNNSLLLYPSDLCPRREPFIFNNALAPNVNRIHLYIANNFVRVTNDQGCDLEMCWDGCSFALNGQPDASSGGPNEEIYIGINRQVRDTPSLSRSGWGVCRVACRWMCPWIEWPKGDCDIV